MGGSDAEASYTAPGAAVKAVHKLCQIRKTALRMF
jgi:hypothetical protein